MDEHASDQNSLRDAGDYAFHLQKSLFKLCHKLVKKRYADNDPENDRHAGLIALFLFNFWNATGLLPMAQAMVIFGSSLDGNDDEG